MLLVSQKNVNADSKCKRRLKIRKYINQTTAKRIYKSVILSKLHCGLLLTVIASKRDKIQKFKNFLCDRYTTNVSLHVQNRVLPIEHRCKVDLLIFIHNTAVGKGFFHTLVHNQYCVLPKLQMCVDQIYYNHRTKLNV